VSESGLSLSMVDVLKATPTLKTPMAVVTSSMSYWPIAPIMTRLLLRRSWMQSGHDPSPRHETEGPRAKKPRDVVDQKAAW